MDTALKLYKILLIKWNQRKQQQIQSAMVKQIIFLLWYLLILFFYIFRFLIPYPFGLITMFSPILCQIIYLLPNNSLLEYVLPVLSHTPDLNN